jgi:hypothetical protein
VTAAVGGAERSPVARPFFAAPRGGRACRAACAGLGDIRDLIRECGALPLRRARFLQDLGCLRVSTLLRAIPARFLPPRSIDARGRACRSTVLRHVGIRDQALVCWKLWRTPTAHSSCSTASSPLLHCRSCLARHLRPRCSPPLLRRAGLCSFPGLGLWAMQVAYLMSSHQRSTVWLSDGSSRRCTLKSPNCSSPEVVQTRPAGCYLLLLLRDGRACRAARAGQTACELLRVPVLRGAIHPAPRRAGAPQGVPC